MRRNPMKQSFSDVHYQVFLLKQWQERDSMGNRLPVWRFVVESPSTGARRGFRSTRDLAAFLEEQMAVISKQTNSDHKEEQ